MIGVNVGRLFNPSLKIPASGGGSSNTLLTGLLDYYKFDENTGSTVGDSKGTDNGTWHGTGTHWTSSGKINSGGLFASATSDYVSIPSYAGIEFLPTDHFSISLWFQTTTTSVSNAVFDKSSNTGSQFRILGVLNGDGTFSYFLNQQGSGSTNMQTGSLSINTWYHVVLTADGANANLYVNGSLVQGPTSYAAQSGAGHMVGQITLGSAYNITQFWDGKIDEVGIWNVALSQANITALYNSGAGLAFSNFH